MAWTATRSLLGRLLEEHLNGSPPPDPNKFFLILTNASTFTDTSDLVAIIQQEVAQVSGYSRQQYKPATAGTYDAAQGRYEMPPVTLTFTAASGPIQFDRAVLVSDGSAEANKIFTADASTNRLTITASGLVNGDRVVPTADPGGTLPAGMSAIAYYAKSIDANTVELYLEPALTTILDFTTNGSGTLRLRYAQGNVELFETFGSSTIPAGATQNIILYFNAGGNGVDVNAV